MEGRGDSREREDENKTERRADEQLRPSRRAEQRKTETIGVTEGKEDGARVHVCDCHNEVTLDTPPNSLIGSVHFSTRAGGQQRDASATLITHTHTHTHTTQGHLTHLL